MSGVSRTPIQTSTGTIQAPGTEPVAARRPPLAPCGRENRLARWIASEENPCTDRVLVNRVWQACFGHGQVETPNDFGLAGTRPGGPPLLQERSLPELCRALLNLNEFIHLD